MKFEIPESLRAEHEELHEELARAVKMGGDVGNAAEKVARVLHSHFQREEEFALPPLGLLGIIAVRKVDMEMKEVLDMTGRLKSEIGQMLNEHRDIIKALNDLAKVARRAKRPEVVKFAEKLKMHAMNEEEVLYPASLLVGRYVEERITHLEYGEHSGGCC